jgi:hypothetical protein
VKGGANCDQHGPHGTRRYAPAWRRWVAASFPRLGLGLTALSYPRIISRVHTQETQLFNSPIRRTVEGKMDGWEKGGGEGEERRSPAYILLKY